jgi:phosphate transport system protein
MSEDYRKALHQEIDLIAADLVQLGEMAHVTITRATAAFLDLDEDGVEEVVDALVAADDDVDALAVDIEERCIRCLALQSPMASDLRMVVSSLKINAAVERCADLMVNVATSTRRLRSATLTPRLRGLVQRMADEAARLLRLAMDAYAQRNGALGAALDDMDDRLDALQGELVQAIFEAHAAGCIDLQAAVQLAVVARYYERVGDQAVNIGERVEFVAGVGAGAGRAGSGSSAPSPGP